MSKQRGFTKFSVFLKRVSLLNPRVRTIFVAFPLEREPGKSLEVWFDFGPRPGFSKQLFGSGREGTNLDWTYFNQFLFRFANPFSPYSIQKRPKRQICPKFVPAIVFGGFQSGGLEFEKSCQNLKNGNFQTNFDNFFQTFVPLTGTPQKQSLRQILDKFGVSGVFECCKGKKGSQI